jgi:hypothetical protein
MDDDFDRLTTADTLPDISAYGDKADVDDEADMSSEDQEDSIAEGPGCNLSKESSGRDLDEAARDVDEVRSDEDCQCYNELPTVSRFLQQPVPRCLSKEFSGWDLKDEVAPDVDETRPDEDCQCYKALPTVASFLQQPVAQCPNKDFSVRDLKDEAARDFERNPDEDGQCYKSLPTVASFLQQPVPRCPAPYNGRKTMAERIVRMATASRRCLR